MKLEFITSKGDVLEFTNQNDFKITNIDGLTSSNIALSSSTIASMDGDIVTNKRAIPRTIIIDLTINREVELTKNYIFQYIKPKQKGTLRLTINNRVLTIGALIENIEMPRFSSLVVLQITFYCSQPFWEDEQESVEQIAAVKDLHYFTNIEGDMLYFPDSGIPFSVYDVTRSKVFKNEGDVEVGLIIHIIALDSVTNPRIYNSKGEFLGIVGTLSQGDEVIINTNKGNKSITLNGTNILSKLEEGSTWLQLPLFEENFTISSSDGKLNNMYFTIEYRQRFV